MSRTIDDLKIWFERSHQASHTYGATIEEKIITAIVEQNERLDSIERQLRALQSEAE